MYARRVLLLISPNKRNTQFSLSGCPVPVKVDFREISGLRPRCRMGSNIHTFGRYITIACGSRRGFSQPTALRMERKESDQKAFCTIQEAVARREKTKEKITMNRSNFHERKTVMTWVVQYSSTVWRFSGLHSRMIIDRSRMETWCRLTETDYQRSLPAKINRILLRTDRGNWSYCCQMKIFLH